MTLSCIAIDDEPIALKIIKLHAEKVSFISLKETFISPTAALDFLKHTPVDLVFLDINMPDISGLDLVKHVDSTPAIVFTTAHAHYAVQGFELAVADFLLKPINYNRFLQACTRVQSDLGKERSNDRRSFFVKNGFEWVKIETGNLLYVEASDNYIVYHEPDRKTMVRMTLNEAEKQLTSKDFIRVHKSFIINFSKIEKVERHQVTICGKKVPVSLSYQKTLFERL